jgi:transcriptional regulator with XRE-family HTH domain
LRELLIEARSRAGLTQVAVAERLGRPQSFVSKYEVGERRLDVVEFLEVCAAVGADPVKILRQVEVARGQ